MFQASEPNSWILAVAAVVIAIMAILLWAFINNFIADFKAVKTKVEDHDISITKLKTLEAGRVDVLEEIKKGIDGLNTKLERALEEIKHLTIEHEKMKAKCELHREE